MLWPFISKVICLKLNNHQFVPDKQLVISHLLLEILFFTWRELYKPIDSQNLSSNIFHVWIYQCNSLRYAILCTFCFFLFICLFLSKGSKRWSSTWQYNLISNQELCIHLCAHKLTVFMATLSLSNKGYLWFSREKCPNRS